MLRRTSSLVLSLVTAGAGSACHAPEAATQASAPATQSGRTASEPGRQRAACVAGGPLFHCDACVLID